MCLSGAFSKGAMEIFTHLAKEKFPGPPTPDNPPGTYSYRIARHNGFSDWWMRIVSETYSIAWRNLLCQEPEFAKPMLQQPYQWTMQLKFSKWNPLGTTHKRYELILRIRVIYNIRAINHHHVLPCKTCLMIQWMQRYPNPQMRTRRSFPMSDPGQLQTIQAAARDVTQDRRIGIKLHHINRIQKDLTCWLI